MDDPGVAELLRRLSSERPGAAWSEFLERYSPLVMHVIRRYEAAHGPVMDCFVYVCGALCDDDFRRLRSFRLDGPARFETWLKAVVANLCVDWRRRQRGRLRPVRAVARLPELDQLVYRLIYVRGMPRAECLHVLRARYPDLTERALSEINARLHALLPPRQRWQLSLRPSTPVTVGDGADGEDDSALQLEAPGPGPDGDAEQEQRQRLVRDALANLPNTQRLLLKMRYEQNLTLEQIARLTGQPDPFRVHRQVQAALAALREQLAPQVALATAKPRDASV
jgi:RNA polymerase sigma factor (sigma-70 family)